MKKSLALFLALLLCAALFVSCAPAPSVQPPAASEAPAQAKPEAPAAQEPPAKRSFTDSAGRSVELPAKIDKIAVSGPLAQIVVFALAPEKLVGISSAWDKSAAQYLSAESYALPVIGQLYGGKGEMNLEELLASGAQLVIDVGEPKGSIAEDMDALQAQTGLPFVHVDAFTASMGDTYRMLGALLGMETEAEALASYCERVYANAQALCESVDKVSALYITGEEGHNVIAKGSYHAEVIDMFVDNAAVVNEPSSKGTGNEVDMEQILLWNPDVLLFEYSSIYDEIPQEDAFQKLKAVQEGRYYKVPFGPYNWMGFPPSVQRYLGMLWMGSLLYPEATGYDLKTEVREYYKLFYHCDLSDAQYEALVAESIGKK